MTFRLIDGLPQLQALQLADPHEMGYVVRWPLYGGHVNARDYPSNQLVLSDIEVVLRETLSKSLSIDQKSYNVRLYPVASFRAIEDTTVGLIHCLCCVYQGLLRSPGYTRPLRKDVREGSDRYPIVEDGIQTDMCAAGKFDPPPLSLHFPIPETFHFRRSD